MDLGRGNGGGGRTGGNAPVTAYAMGEYVVLRAADFRLPVELVHAKGSKAARAEPVALRFETGRAKLAGAFPELEDELCALTYAGFENSSNSPDRADAMVWAMSALLEQRPELRIRRL